MGDRWLAERDFIELWECGPGIIIVRMEGNKGFDPVNSMGGRIATDTKGTMLAGG